MEPVTHALTCFALGRAGLNKLTRAATPMLLVSGLIADVDWATRLGGAETYLRGHRTATHSLVGTAAIIVIVGAASWLAGRKFPKFAVGFFAALWICAIGAASHGLLDLLNSDGVQLLWPLRAKRFAWDLADSLDAWILCFLLAGLLLPGLFKLITNEIGSKSKPNAPQRGAVAGLVFVMLLIGVRVVAHQRALALLGSREYLGQTPRVVAALPNSWNPLFWSGLVETDNAFFNVDVSLTPNQRFDPDTADAHYKPDPSLTLKNAASSPATIEFLNYARFPLASVEPKGNGFEVRLRDLRFASEPAGWRGIIAVIDLNAQSVVIEDHLEFNSGSVERSRVRGPLESEPRREIKRQHHQSGDRGDFQLVRCQELACLIAIAHR